MRRVAESLQPAHTCPSCCSACCWRGALGSGGGGLQAEFLEAACCCTCSPSTCCCCSLLLGGALVLHILLTSSSSSLMPPLAATELLPLLLKALQLQLKLLLLILILQSEAVALPQLLSKGMGKALQPLSARRQLDKRGWQRAASHTQQLKPGVVEAVLLRQTWTSYEHPVAAWRGLQKARPACSSCSEKEGRVAW